MRSNVAPPDPAEWLFAIGGRTYHARPLRPWHVTVYVGRVADAQRDPGRVRRARWWLFRCAMPWRLSYLLRGDPVSLTLAASPEEQARALARILEHVRPVPATSPPLIDQAMSFLEQP